MKKLLKIIIIILFVSCNRNNSSEKGNNSRVVIDFLTYYEANYEKIYEKDIFEYEPIYSVNFENVKLFESRIKLTEYFTEKYQNKFIQKLNGINKQLKNKPQNDGTIDGFEGDIFLLTNDIDETLNEIKSKKFQCKTEENKVNVKFESGANLLFIVKYDRIDEIR